MPQPVQDLLHWGIYRGMQVQQYLPTMHVFDTFICYWLCSLLDQVLSLSVRIMPMVGLSSVPWTAWLPVFVKCRRLFRIIAVFLLMLKSSDRFLRSDFGGISCRRRNTCLFMRMFLLTCLGMLGNSMLLIAFVDSEGCHHTCLVRQTVLVGSAGFSVCKKGGYVTKFKQKKKEKGFRSCSMLVLL